MKKILSFLLLGLICSIGNVWGDNTLFSVDFSDETTEQITTESSSAVFVERTYDGFNMSMGIKSSSTMAIVEDGLEFSGSNYNTYCCLAIPLSLTSGNEVTVNVVLATSGQVKYAFVKGALPAAPSGIGNGTQTPSSSKAESFSFSYTPDETGQAVLYIGRAGSSNGKVVKSIVITEAAGGSEPEPGDDPTPVDPTITFNAGAYTVGGAALNLSTLFTSNSAGAVTYSVKTDGGTGAAIEGTSFTATAAGTAVVTASQAAATGYNAKSVDANIVVSAAADPEPVVESNDIFSAVVVATSDQNFATGTTAITAQQATIVGGSMSAVSEQTNEKKLIASQNGVYYFAMTNNNTFFKVELNSALAEGDVISANVMTNGAGDSNKRGIWVSTATSRPNDAPAAALTAFSATAKEAVNVSYEVVAEDEYVGKTVLYIYRETGNSTYFGDFKVVRPAPSTDPKITAADASIAATESGVEVTENIAVVGANLTGSTLTATLSPAVDGLSVTLDANTITDGAISTNAVLHYTQTVNVPEGQTTLTLSDGTTSKEVTITYSALVIPWELQSISEAKSWDFSTLSGGIRFTGDSISTEYVYANILEIVCPSSFDAMALAFTGEYPLREGKGVAQNGTLHFNTTVAGSIVVKFSDTGTSASKTAVKRYLVVNGETTEYWASRENNSDDPAVAYDAQLNVTSGAIHVPAGDVTISGTSALVYQKLEFYPDVELTLGANGYSTYAADYKFSVSGAEVYRAAYDGGLNAVVLTQLASPVVPANTGVILKGVAGDEAVIARSSEDAADMTGNQLIGVVAATAAPEKAYVIATDLDNDGLTKFHPCAGIEIPAHKAYLIIESVTHAPVRVIFAENGATAIDNIEGADDAVKFVENGVLYIRRNGVVYTTTGQVVR